MPDVNELKVHDVQISEVPSFGLRGQTAFKKVLTFFVGSHGPFVREYPPGQGDTAQMRADIEHQVVELRRLVEGQE